ncbi:unnamed protein product [Bursaphelenchus okinawaensis]|uniref:SEC7 domain-containing protein n=1 Tax=Bursaphelenchus okinawaensis TaxID=465554 RepID=A0A811JW12_9BILA|nr:unnamed protein product [Bursaphelenchus okinawaensis]CAG9085671.1 unnamed protein product [Bursaphelenchus okinawaensis]
MFLKTSIEKLLHESSIHKKHNAELKKACENALEQLKREAEQNDNNNKGAVLPSHHGYVFADPYFLPLDLACRSTTPKIAAIALDCIQKLVTYGHLVGNTPDPADPNKMLIDRIVEAVCTPFDGPNTDENVELQIIKAILAMVLSSNTQVHEGALLTCVRTCFNICLATRNATNCSTARATLTQIVTRVLEKMEENEYDGEFAVESDDNVVKSVLDQIVSDVVHNEEHCDERSLKSNEEYTNSNTTVNDQLVLKTIEERDAFFTFRAMCLLSEKGAKSAEIQSHQLNSLHLSLDMILLMLQKSKITFPDKHSFVYVLRYNLCPALSKTASSSVISVFEKSLAIVVELINKFRAHLKPQIEVFFTTVILHFLESNTSDFEHKWISLNTVSKICDDPQSVVDIYVNYDCAMTSVNVFQQLVEQLSKLTKSTALMQHTTQSAKEKEKYIRELSLVCLVKILRCLVGWYENMYKEEDSQSRIDENPDDLSANNSSTALSQFEQRKQQKSILEHGLDLFAAKPKKGLEYFISKGIIENSPTSIANFFFTEERLSKETIGDYLGERDQFNQDVMMAYVDMFSFSNQSVVDALRRFLEKFRIPGEAQKVDRLMEKFASRYIECNESAQSYASADTIYVLSYSIVMLTTDLHNKQVKKKMTKEEYIKNIRALNYTNDLSDDFIIKIYEDISKQGIKLKAEKTKWKVDTTNATYRQLKLIQKSEFELIAHNAHSLMEAATSAQTEYTSATHLEHVRPIFEVIWQPCYAAFSIGLQSSDEMDIWSRCLDGFRYSIRVSCVFRMKNERNVFVDALKKFTKLATKNLSDMKAKNVEAIKLLITVGDENGDFLDERWLDVLDCISQLEIAQQLGSGKNPEDLRRALNVTDKSLGTLQEYLDETQGQSVEVAVDKIFQNSSKLTGEAIVHFVDALCKVSRNELAIPGAPRMYMLQKIVEISFYNMNRIRIEWSVIWKKLGELFNTAGGSSNETISYFALDALKQLSSKFLEKGELPNFSFQKEFLRPFELIMERSQSQSRREFIIQCIGNMVKSHSNRIRSGWKNIFSVCAIAALDQRAEIVESAFKITSDIVNNVFPDHFVELLDSFQEAIKCLSEFAGNTDFADTSMEAIALIRSAATLVYNNSELINTHASEDDAALEQSTQKVWMKGWLPIIFELSRVINRCKLDVRTRSLTVMFEIVKTYGADFRLDWWTDLFHIVFRIFDFDKLNQLGPEKSIWMETTCHHALYSINDVFTCYFEQLAPTLLSVYYQQLYACIMNGSGNLAPNAVQCFASLVSENGHKFSDQMWNETSDFIIKVFNESLPDFDRTDPALVEAANPQPSVNPDSTMPNGIQPVKTINNIEDGGPIQNGYDIVTESATIQNSSLIRCHVQLELVNSISNMLFGSAAFKVEGPIRKTEPQTPNGSISNGIIDEFSDFRGEYAHVPTKVLLSIVDEMKRSHDVARLFNTVQKYRNILFKATLKIKDLKNKPNMLKLESHSIHCALNVLHRLYADCQDKSEILDMRNRLVGTTEDALQYYLDLHSEHHRSSWLAVLQMLLNRTAALDQDKLDLLGKEYQLKLVELVVSPEQPIVKEALKRVIVRFLQ